MVDRRRIELIEPGLSPAPIHYESGRLDVAETAALVAKVRASVARAASAALDELAGALPAPVVSISLRSWPLDFPDDIAIQRRVPYEARADAIMYRQELWSSRTPVAGTSTCMTRGQWRARRRESWASGPTTPCTDHEPRWARPGRRTIGSRSPRRSWPVEGRRTRALSGTRAPRPPCISVRPVTRVGRGARPLRALFNAAAGRKFDATGGWCQPPVTSRRRNTVNAHADRGDRVERGDPCGADDRRPVDRLAQQALPGVELGRQQVRLEEVERRRSSRGSAAGSRPSACRPPRPPSCGVRVDSSSAIDAIAISGSAYVERAGGGQVQRAADADRRARQRRQRLEAERAARRPPSPTPT